MKKNLLLILILFIPLVGLGQIWKETFDDLPNGTTVDNGPTAWSTIAPSSYDIFSKQSYATYRIFTVNNTGNEEGIWLSEEIDISSSPEVAIEITLGSYWASSTDYIRCYYKLDGGQEILFGEQFGATDLNIASLASAIVSGSRLQIIIKASENTPGTYNTFPRIMAVDDITVSSITYLYAINSGNWNISGTWSLSGYNGVSCACIPNNNSHVFIGNNKNVTLNGIAESGGLTVEGSGRLNYTANGQLKILRGGKLEIKSGGEISRNGNSGTSLSLSTYSYQIHVDGDFSVDNIILNAANVRFSGNGNIDVQNNFTVNNVVGKSLVNNLSGNFSIGNNLNFSSTSSNLSFSNNGNLQIANSLNFDNGNVLLENSGNLTIANNGIVVVNNTDNGNTIKNFGTLGVKNINLNNGDFTLSNYGTINQTGDFANIDDGSRFENREGSSWNFSGAGSNSRLYTQYSNNIFSYEKAGTQDLFTPADGAYENLHLNGSGVKSVTGILDVKNDLIISGTSKLDVTTGIFPVVIGGDLMVSSSINEPFVARSGRVTFNGLENQSITSELGSVTFNDLEIDKVSGDVILSTSFPTDLNLTNLLILKAGGLDLNGNRLEVSNPDKTAISRIDGFIKSEIATAPYSAVIWSVGESTGAYVFPFGTSATSADYIPFTFDIQTPGIANGTISVATYGTGQDNLPYPEEVEWLGNDMANMAADRFWQIDLAGYSTNPVANVTFTTTEVEKELLGTLRAQRWNSVATTWDQPIQGQMNVSENSVTVPMVNNFSPWTLMDESSLLPVELIYFKAEASAKKIVLEWKTAQEINNDYFTLEKSNDLNDFVEVSKINGNGSSLQEHIYQVIDEFPFKGLTYYRLKQTDFDGTSEYSKVISAEISKHIDRLILFPNPSNGKEIIIKEGNIKDLQNQDIKIFNMNGQNVYSGAEFSRHSMGMIMLKFKRTLSPGVYWITIGKLYSEKLLVN